MLPTGLAAQRTLVLGATAERAVTLVPSTLEAHTTDSRYDIRTLLGEGGMGEVRLCTDLHIGREVAMKAMRPAQLARADLRARFLREARIQGQLEHPAIVPVYDLGFGEEGALYFTMRRLRGDTLEALFKRLREGDPRASTEYPLHKLLSAFSRVCLAVHFAHTKGVVHRDLKPANIMLGDFGEVYVLDWGVAKLFATDTAPISQSAEASASPHLDLTEMVSAKTASGAVIGTPGYMAPEQILGQSNEVNPQSDVFALGSMLFEILTHDPLFGDGETPSILGRTLRGEGRSAIERAPHLAISAVLDEVCLKATDPFPERRYRTAREISEALEGYLAGDLDLERRRALARTHGQLARDAAARALGPSGTQEDRTEALREVGRSLALDPGDAEALALLVRLVTAPPTELPAEITQEIAAQEDRRIGKSQQQGALLFALITTLFVMPLALLTGIKTPGYVAAHLVLWGLTPAALFFMKRLPFLGVIAIYAAVASSSLIFGPFVSVPAMAAIVTVAIVHIGKRSTRVLATVLGVLALLVPVALEWGGALPRSYAFEGDRIVIFARAVHFPTAMGQALLIATHVATVLFVAYFAGRSKDALARAEQQNRVRAWQLRQLVPSEARGALLTHGKNPPSERIALLDPRGRERQGAPGP